MILDGRAIDVVRIAPRAVDAPTLVFLHEGLGSVGLWRDFPARLVERTGFGALVYSRAGNGFSNVVRAPREPGYMHDEALQTLPSLLDAQSIRRAILIGHSDGASIALIFAANFPERADAIVAIAPHVFVEAISLQSIGRIRERYATGELRARMAPHHADVDATFYGWNDIWLHPAFRDWSIEAELARITAPILAVQGGNDEYGTLAQLDSISQHVVAPVDRLILARCGHAPHRNRPELTIETIAAWVAQFDVSKP